MKKVVLSFVVFFIMVSSLVVVGAVEDANVVIDGKFVNFELSPQLINERTLVCAREVMEKFGAVVEWNGQSNEIVAKKGTTTISAKVNDNKLYVNDNCLLMDTPCLMIDGKVMLPIKYIADAMHYPLLWDIDSNTAYVTTEKSYNNIVIDDYFLDYISTENNQGGFSIHNISIDNVEFNSLKELVAHFNINGKTIGEVKSLRLYMEFYNEYGDYVGNHEIIKVVPDNAEFVFDIYTRVPEGTTHIKFKRYREYVKDFTRGFSY